jgi:hypothetical protein
MGIRLSSSGAAALAALIAGALLPVTAPARAELYFLPSLALTGNYDDNLFFTPDDHEDDYFLRLRPAVKAGYRSLPTNFSLNYSFDLERYDRHQDLDSDKARQDLALDYSFRPSQILTLGVNADYLRTRSPSELVALTGVGFGRVFAERRSFNPTLEYQYDSLTTATAGYQYIRDKITNGIGSDVNTASAGVDRRLAPQAGISFRYRFDRFHFDNGVVVNANTLLFGGNYAYSKRLTLSALAGPRFTSSDTTDASASAELRYEIDHGEVALNYDRQQTTVLGVGAAVNSDGLAATLLLMTAPDVELRAVPSYAVSTNDGLRTEVYRFLLEAGWQASRYLTVVGSYEFNAQHGDLTAAGGGETIHNVIMLGIVIAPPQRFGTETRRRFYLPSNLGGEPAAVPGKLRESPSLEEDKP